MKISGALICKNEERCIKRCLDSYRHIADELIVVDTGSTDSTVEIAKECGATVLHFDWIDDFSAARNFALEHCTGDWIVFLDADEWFQEGEADTLLRYIKRYHGDRRYQGFTLFMRNIDLSRRHQGLSEFDSIHQSLRAFRNLRNLRYKGKIHEMLQYGDKEMNTLRIEREDVTLLHDGYRVETIREKGLRNVQGNIDTWEETRDPNYLHYAAMDLCNLEEDEEALKYFNMYFETGHYSEYFGVYPHKLAARSMRKLKYPQEEIRDLIYNVSDKYPDNAGAQFLKADFLFRNHDYEGAYALYEKVDRLLGSSPEEKLDFGFTIGGDGYSRMFCNMAEMQALRGDKQTARQLYERALRWRKEDSRALQGMAWLLREERPEDVLAYWQRSFDFANIDDVNALLRAYSLRKPGTEYLLLFEKYFTLTQKQDLYFFLMLLIIGEYKQAFDAFSTRHVATGTTNYGIKAILTSFMADKLEWNDSYRDFFTEGYSGMIDALRDGSPLQGDQGTNYLLLLNDMSKFMQPGDNRLYTALKPVLPLSDKEKLPYIDIFQYSDHDAVTEYLLDSLQCEEEAVRLQEYRLRTMLAYKQRDFDKARKYIKLAQEAGAEKGLFEVYEHWMEEKENA